MEEKFEFVHTVRFSIAQESTIGRTSTFFHLRGERYVSRPIRPTIAALMGKPERAREKRRTKRKTILPVHDDSPDFTYLILVVEGNAFRSASVLFIIGATGKDYLIASRRPRDFVSL